jgi:hydroxyacylglutathione hydrolase
VARCPVFVLTSVLILIRGKTGRGPPTASPVKPDILIVEELDLSKFGVDGKVIRTPCHTPGSLSVILPNGEFIVGDLIMKGIVRFWQPNYPLFADNMFQLKENLKLVLRKKPSKIYCTHGSAVAERAWLPWAVFQP